MAYPEFLPAPSAEAMTNCLATLIDGLDPIRAHLLTRIVYRGHLSSWSAINESTRNRITDAAGEHYERLREWLQSATDDPMPLNQFLSQIIDSVLKQPGYILFNNPEGTSCCRKPDIVSGTI